MKKADFHFDLGKNEVFYLEKQIRARIGRNLFGDEIFYRVLLEDDTFIEKAMSEF